MLDFGNESGLLRAGVEELNERLIPASHHYSIRTPPSLPWLHKKPRFFGALLGYSGQRMKLCIFSTYPRRDSVRRRMCRCWVFLPLYGFVLLSCSLTSVCRRHRLSSSVEERRVLLGLRSRGYWNCCYPTFPIEFDSLFKMLYYTLISSLPSCYYGFIVSSLLSCPAYQSPVDLIVVRFFVALTQHYLTFLLHLKVRKVHAGLITNSDYVFKIPGEDVFNVSCRKIPCG